MRLGIKRKENWSDLKKRIEKDHGVKRRKKRGTAIIFSFFLWFFGLCFGLLLQNVSLAFVLSLGFPFLRHGFVVKKMYWNRRKSRIAFLKGKTAEVALLQEDDPMRRDFHRLQVLEQANMLPAGVEQEVRKQWIEVLRPQEIYERKIRKMPVQITVWFFFFAGIVIMLAIFQPKVQNFLLTTNGKRWIAFGMAVFLFSVCTVLHGYGSLEDKR